MIAKTPRRKYRYPDRAAAEDAQAESEHRFLLQLRLARALFVANTTPGAMLWTRTHGSYRCGLFDTQSPGGPKLAWVFHPPTGQEPSILVADAWDSDFLAKQEHFAMYQDNEENRDILAVCAEMRQLVKEHAQ